MKTLTSGGEDKAVNEPRKRHRWKMASDHFYPGPKLWRCIQCGLQKITEFECKPRYNMHDGREWHRFAPPCPPPEMQETTAHAPA
jgi:hypothetical protein